MSVFWTVVLLNSLLIPSQGHGLLSLVHRGDTKGMSDSPAKGYPPSSEGGLLGKDGVVGGLLGKNGAVGSLLGKDGAVGGLLGKDGAVGSLLGKDGAVGSLLGKDGAVGGLLGKDGAVGGLLGKDGAVGGLLGKDGAVGGLLGGLLGKDGVVSGLLDKDGILGGLLGKGGVVDDLLGKDGLVDTLVDTVLELLIGKRGVLGKNGFVGIFIDSNHEDHTGVRILNNTLPKISLHSKPGFGHQVDFNTQLLVESSVPGQTFCKQVEVDVTILVQDTWTAHQNALSCKTVEINTYVRPKIPALDEPLKRLLSKVLQDLGCNIINAKVKVLSSLLGSGNQVLPLGALGDLPSFSIHSADAIQMDLKLLSENARGGTSAPMQGLPLTASLTLATGHQPRLSLSQDTLSALLKQVQGQEALSLSITSLTGSKYPLYGQVSESSSLTIDALFPFIPQLAHVFPGSLPLELCVRVSKEPVVTVRDGRATVTIKASIDAISPALKTSQGLVFSLDVDIVLNITPSVSDGKLQTSVSLDSIHLTRFPSSLDAHAVSSLTEWIKKVLTNVYVPSIRDAFHVSVPLPSILNTSLKNVEVDITYVDEFSSHTSLERFCPRRA